MGRLFKGDGSFDLCDDVERPVEHWHKPKPVPKPNPRKSKFEEVQDAIRIMNTRAFDLAADKSPRNTAGQKVGVNIYEACLRNTKKGICMGVLMQVGTSLLSKCDECGHVENTYQLHTP